jgi:hypothetical protein
MAAPVGSHFSMPGTMAARMTCSTNRVQAIAATMAPIVFLVSAPSATPIIPKQAAETTVPRPATTATLTAKTRARCGVASRTGTMVRCRNSLPAARMPRMSMTTQVIAPNLSIW